MLYFIHFRIISSPFHLKESCSCNKIPLYSHKRGGGGTGYCGYFIEWTFININWFFNFHSQVRKYIFVVSVLYFIDLYLKVEGWNWDGLLEARPILLSILPSLQAESRLKSKSSKKTLVIRNFGTNEFIILS